jgi:hypothetical protein
VVDSMYVIDSASTGPVAPVQRPIRAARPASRGPIILSAEMAIIDWKLMSLALPSGLPRARTVRLDRSSPQSDSMLIPMRHENN